jgi:hypothetical protein
VIDPLSHFLHLPDKPSERAFASHELLADLESLAEARQVAIVCVESARRGGVIGTAERTQWRASYDPAFKTVWGVARDPRDRAQRLFLPVRHHLGDDRTGLQFTIEPGDRGIAQIAWGNPDDTLTFAEATSRVRLGRKLLTSMMLAQSVGSCKESNDFEACKKFRSGRARKRDRLMLTAITGVHLFHLGPNGYKNNTVTRP